MYKQICATSQPLKGNLLQRYKLQKLCRMHRHDLGASAENRARYLELEL